MAQIGREVGQSEVEREGQALVSKPAPSQVGLKLSRTDLTISVEPPWEVMSPSSIQSPRNELLLKIPDLISVNWKESFVLGQTTHSSDQFAKARFVSDGGSIEGKSLFVGNWNRAEVKRWVEQMSLFCTAASPFLAVWPVVGNECPVVKWMLDDGFRGAFAICGH